MEDRGQLAKYFDEDDLSTSFSINNLKNYFTSVGLTVSRPFVQQYIKLLFKLAELHQSELVAFFNQELTLSQLCNIFINVCYKDKGTVAASDVLTVWQDHNSKINCCIWDNLLLSNKPNINLFSYGIGNADYERSIKDAFEKKPSSTLNIYGYEPYAGDSAINYALPKNKLISFDFILAKWVLHHVEDKLRWSQITKYLNMMRRDGVFIIVEHGFNQNSFKDFYTTVSDLLNGTYDVVTNYYLRPTGFISHEHHSHNFNVKYLDMQDVKEISNNRNYTIFRLTDTFPVHDVIIMN